MTAPELVVHGEIDNDDDGGEHEIRCKLHNLLVMLPLSASSMTEQNTGRIKAGPKRFRNRLTVHIPCSYH